MSSMLCQGLQSCFEPRFVEPQAIGLKLAPPTTKSFFLELAIKPTATYTSVTEELLVRTTSHKNNEAVAKTTATKCGWSLLESLTTTTSSETLKNADVVVANKETPYVHPLVKRYSSRLSDKSLELCTESLGSETGSDIGEDSDFYYSSSSDSESETARAAAPQRMRHNSGTFANKRVVNNKSGSFPPPLTSISGSNSIQVRPHRENGRLVIRTVAAPRPQTYFQAERRDGRLTLRFTQDYLCNNVQSQLEEAVEEEIHEEETEQEVENKEEGEVVDAKTVQEETKEEEAEIENDFDFDFEEETDGNRYNVGGEMGTEKYHHQRPRSCKESRQGKNGLLSWEPFWVAT